jgi:Rieske Fe-S protein
LNRSAIYDVMGGMSDPLSRRTALAVTGIGLSAPALAACGSSDNGASSAPPTGADTTSSAPSSSSGDNLGPASAVQVGGGKIYASQNVVVTQPTAGEFKAFSATCTHMGCQVAKVADGKIQCPCHGSQYSITDGSVVGGPAPAPLPAKQVSDQGGNLIVS